MTQKFPFLPERPAQPRDYGITMMMDKGLSLREAENFIQSSSEYTDLVKLGFGTALITKNLSEKVKLYKSAGLKPYFGGTLFEMFIVRGMFDDYRRFLEENEMEMAEVSDGSINLPHDQKLEYIQKLSEQVTVLSEVGSKRVDIFLPPDEWVSEMKTELEAGAWKVIAEARESGTIGIYNKDGSANIALIEDIRHHVKIENVLWEAPKKNQQVWFIKSMGANVNLGNIAPNEVVPLEALRQGLRGDTFFEELPEDVVQEYRPE